MTKESNLFITFLKSFSSYIIYILVLGLGVEIISKNNNLKDYAQLLSGIVFVVLAYSVYRKKINESFKNFLKDIKSDGFRVFIMSFLFIVLEIVVFKILTLCGINSPNQIESMRELKNATIPLIIYYTLIGTISEEICFRLPYVYCNSKNKLVTYIFYSVVFASIHLLLTSSLLELLYVIPYLLLSFGIGYGFYKTDNILLSTIVHIINNSLGIMLILL